MNTSTDDVPEPMFAKISAVAAAREKEHLAKHIRRSRRRLLERGFLADGRVPYGLVRVLVDPGTGAVVRVLGQGESVSRPGTRVSLRLGPEEQVAIVRRLFDGIESGQSVASLAEDLNVRKVPPPSVASRVAAGVADPGRRETGWNRSAVWLILRNEIYTGVLVYGRVQAGESPGDGDTPGNGLGRVRVEGFYPDPPISREQFARVQERLAARAPHARKCMLQEDGE